MSAFVRACHPLPTLAVTIVITSFAWAVGWRWPAVAGVLAAVLVGQLSVGWSNDAFDARTDLAASRAEKPTVAGAVTARALWAGAAGALALSAALSWVVAGLVGGSFHVFALLMAWLYNTALSRTVWSWLPYALAFGAMPAFLTYGLDDAPPPLWAVAGFAIVGVSAHLANALPDIDSDAAAGLDGLAIRLGPRRGLALCWVLLGLGSAILLAVSLPERPLVAALVICAYVGALVFTALVPRKSVLFTALLVVVAVDVVGLVVAGTQVA